MEQYALSFFTVILDRRAEVTTQKAALSPDVTCKIGPFHVSIKRSLGCQLYTDDDAGLTILIHGQISGNRSVSSVLDAYRHQGEQFAVNLDGSFALLILDREKHCVVLTTDRVASRKVYVWENSDFVMISTSLFQLCSILPRDLALDPVGLAWYLSNGVVYNNRTVFRDVRRLGRASCYVITPSTRHTHIYWTYEFVDRSDMRDAPQLANRLKDLLVNAVTECTPMDGPVYLSLSGGYDSVGILGILTNQLKRKDIRTFSYGIDEAGDEESDAFLARVQAEKCNCTHIFLRSYNGSLINSIETNALWGDGVSYFCDESSAWTRLRETPDILNSTGFVADECFGWRDVEIHSERDALNACLINDFSCLRWLKGCLPGKIYVDLEEALRDDISLLLRRCPPTKDLHNIKDFIYLDQRLSHVLLPWRENFAGRIFRVQNPFLGRDILDFMTTVPSALRKGKVLYKRVIMEMFPDLFMLKRARYGGYVPDWGKELIRSRNVLTTTYISTGRSSPFDSFIPPDSVMQILSGRIHPSVLSSPKSLPRRTVRKVLRILHLQKMESRVLQGELSSTTFLLRYLVLQCFLERVEEERANHHWADVG